MKKAKGSPLSTRIMQLPTLICLVLLVAACANTAPVESGAARETAGEPELTLHLPEPGCGCAEEDGRDFTFYDKGISLLLAGEYTEAVASFQRYQRLESSPEVEWEAALAIAYTSILPQSPSYDPSSARAEFERLQGLSVDTRRVHVKSLLMRDALANALQLHAQLDQLASDKRQLTEDLQKREEALKRLRELTLGQRATIP